MDLNSYMTHKIIRVELGPQLYENKIGVNWFWNRFKINSQSVYSETRVGLNPEKKHFQLQQNYFFRTFLNT